MSASELEALLAPLAPQELVVLVGIPGSGKSTFYRTYFAATHGHVSLDVLRRRRTERRVLEELLAAGRPVVVDNTNVRRAEREIYLERARHYGIPARCIELAVSLDDALRRNDAREGKARIPRIGVIIKSRELEPPTLDEGYARIITLWVGDDGGVTMLGVQSSTFNV